MMGDDEISQLAKAFNKLLDQIENAIEAEKSFISNVSHELRTPITSIMGQIEVVLGKSRSAEEYKTLLVSVYEDSQQMADIINGFLELAEANLPEQQLAFSLLRIDDLLFSIMEEFKRRKPHFQINIEFLNDPESGSDLEFYGNEKLLRLFFSNLIDNGCKYSEDKRVKISIDIKPNQLFVYLMDHGIGIPKDEQNKIFMPMYRGSNANGFAGHGIGLTIVKRIADLHHIDLIIESVENIGTTIRLHFDSSKNNFIPLS